MSRRYSSEHWHEKLTPQSVQEASDRVGEKRHTAHPHKPLGLARFGLGAIGVDQPKTERTGLSCGFHATFRGWEASF